MRRTLMLRTVGLLLVSLCVLSAAVLSRGTDVFWRREPGSALDWALGATPLVAAVCSGFCAYSIRSVVPASTATEIITQVSFRRLIISGCLPGVIASWAATALTVLAACSSTWIERGEIVMPHTWPLLLVAAAMHVAACLFGAGVGLVLQGSVIPFVLVLIEIACFFFSQSLGLEPLLRIGGSTGSVADSVVILGRIALLMLCWAAVASSALLVPLAFTHPARFPRNLARAGALAAVMTAIIGVTSYPPDHEIYRDAVGKPTSCRSSVDTTVCARPASGFSPEATAVAIHPLTRALALTGVSSPRVWSLTSYSTQASPGVGQIWANSSGSAVPTPSELEDAVLQGSSFCPNLVTDEKTVAVLTVGGAWLSSRAHEPQEQALSASQRAWVAAPASTTWMHSAVTSLRSCKVSNIKAPPGWEERVSGFRW